MRQLAMRYGAAQHRAHARERRRAGGAAEEGEDGRRLRSGLGNLFSCPEKARPIMELNDAELANAIVALIARKYPRLRLTDEDISEMLFGHPHYRRGCLSSSE